MTCVSLNQELLLIILLPDGQNYKDQECTV